MTGIILDKLKLVLLSFLRVTWSLFVTRLSPVWFCRLNLSSFPCFESSTLTTVFTSHRVPACTESRSLAERQWDELWRERAVQASVLLSSTLWTYTATSLLFLFAQHLIHPLVFGSNSNLNNHDGIWLLLGLALKENCNILCLFCWPEGGTTTLMTRRQILFISAAAYRKWEETARRRIKVITLADQHLRELNMCKYLVKYELTNCSFKGVPAWQLNV